MWLVPFLWQLWSLTVMSVHRPSGQWTPTTSPTHLHSRCPPLVPWWKILTLPGLQIRWVWSGCGLDAHACSRGEFTVTTTVWICTAVQGVTAFILTHVFVDQVSLVRVWLGHAGLLKGYIQWLTWSTSTCVRMKAVTPWTAVHVQMMAVSHSVQGVYAFVLTHIPTQVSQVRVHLASSWHIYLWIGESVSSGCVHLCLDTHTYSGKPVQGSFSFVLAHILVDQVSQSVQGVYTFVLIHIPTQVRQFRVHLASSWHIYLWIRWVTQFKVHPPPSWHAYLWIIKTVSSGYLHFYLWHKYLRIR